MSNKSLFQDGGAPAKKSNSTASLESIGFKNGRKKLKSLSSSLKKKLSKSEQSPGMKRSLISSEDDESPKKKVQKTSVKSNLLTRGIKFASEQEFLQFMSKDSSSKKKVKPVAEDKPSSTCKVSANFNLPKLKSLLDQDDKAPENKSEHKSKLQSAHFRHLNERLYSQSGNQSMKMFKKDPEVFKIYHEGFMAQASKWPVDPLNKIISSIMKISGHLTIADFGCGEARLARALEGSAQVHSFDLVKLNDLVTVCDFANTPLENESCDVVVFCLSLMGTNLRDFIKEANRVLKMGYVTMISKKIFLFF